MKIAYLQEISTTIFATSGVVPRGETVRQLDFPSLPPGADQFQVESGSTQGGWAREA